MRKWRNAALSVENDPADDEPIETDHSSLVGFRFKRGGKRQNGWAWSLQHPPLGVVTVNGS